MRGDELARKLRKWQCEKDETRSRGSQYSTETTHRANQWERHYNEIGFRLAHCQAVVIKSTIFRHSFFFHYYSQLVICSTLFSLAVNLSIAPHSFLLSRLSLFSNELTMASTVQSLLLDGLFRPSPSSWIESE